MIFNLIKPVEPQPFFWIRTEHLNQKVLATLRNHSVTFAYLWPRDISLKDIFEYFLRSNIRERPRASQNLICDDPDWKDVSHQVIFFSKQDFRSYVVGRSKESFLFWVLALSNDFGKIEISEYEVPALIDNYVFLNKMIRTGLRSRWMMPIWWIVLTAKIRLAI